MSGLNFAEVVRNYWPIGLSSLLFVLAFASCDAVKQSDSSTEAVPEEVQPIVYEEFTPDSSNWQSNEEIEVSTAFELNSFTFIYGRDQTVHNGHFVPEDTTDGFGWRLYVFNPKSERVFTSEGAGEAYAYIPHFYKNDVNDKVFIICHFSFEYWFGGDVYLFEKGKIKFIGNIDVEGPEMEISLIDILNIQETKDETIFSFKSDTVLLNPGGEFERIVANDGLRYVYKNERFTFNRR